MGAKGSGVTLENRRGSRGQQRQSPRKHAFMLEQMETFGRQVHPEMLEWLMGWPIGWTAGAPLETGRFLQWLALHGKR